LIKSILSEKKILVASLVVTAIVGMIMPTVHATISNDPFDDGYQDGRNDYLQGNGKNASCDPYNSDPNPDLYCAIYYTGYEAGWNTAQGLFPRQ
jgi:hypothetical protein